MKSISGEQNDDRKHILDEGMIHKWIDAWAAG
jgi:hypothetical protein